MSLVSPRTYQRYTFSHLDTFALCCFITGSFYCSFRMISIRSLTMWPAGPNLAMQMSHHRCNSSIRFCGVYNSSWWPKSLIWGCKQTHWDPMMAKSSPKSQTSLISKESLRMMLGSLAWTKMTIRDGNLGPCVIPDVLHWLYITLQKYATMELELEGLQRPCYFWNNEPTGENKGFETHETSQETKLKQLN